MHPYTHSLTHTQTHTHTRTQPPTQPTTYNMVKSILIRIFMGRVPTGSSRTCMHTRWLVRAYAHAYTHAYAQAYTHACIGLYLRDGLRHCRVFDLDGDRRPFASAGRTDRGECLRACVRILTYTTYALMHTYTIYAHMHAYAAYNICTCTYTVCRPDALIISAGECLRAPLSPSLPPSPPPSLSLSLC